MTALLALLTGAAVIVLSVSLKELWTAHRERAEVEAALQLPASYAVKWRDSDMDRARQEGRIAFLQLIEGVCSPATVAEVRHLFVTGGPRPPVCMVPSFQLPDFSKILVSKADLAWASTNDLRADLGLPPLEATVFERDRPLDRAEAERALVQADRTFAGVSGAEKK